MDVDKLFKLPNVPQSSLNKRKWSEPSAVALQSAKEEGEGSGDGTKRAPSKAIKAARVSGEQEEEDEGEELSFAPGNDADYFVDEDDDGGRFFGGGLTSQQKRILEIMNSSNGNEDEDADTPSTAEEQLRNMRKALVKTERAINKNQEMRMRFGDDPSKFINSEAELDAALKALVVSTTNPSLFYPELIKHGMTSSLCNLLSHENVDITASVIELLEELTDDDVLDVGLDLRSEIEQDDDSHRKGEECVTSLLDSLLECSLVDLLVQNLTRLNDDGSAKTDDAFEAMDVESDANAIYHLLGLVENITSLRSSLAVKFLSDATFLNWLLSRISRRGDHDQNKGYAGELLGVLMQAVSTQSDERDDVFRLFGERGGVVKSLEVLATSRKGEVKDDERGEFLENIFDVLCSALTIKENKLLFHKEEGTELMCILLKSRGITRLRAIKVLNHALSGPFGSVNCVAFVKNQGLKPLFGIYMGKMKHTSQTEITSQDEEHVLEIFSSLLNNLKSDSMERIRLISKFVENDYEKVDRLLEMRSAIRSRLRPIEEKVEKEGTAVAREGAEEAHLLSYLERMDSGLYSLQLIDYVLAWLIMEDDGILRQVEMIFGRSDLSLNDVVKTLKEYYEMVGEDAFVSLSEEEDPVREEGQGDHSGLQLKEVIVQLVNFLLQVA
ncbi:hypothetical protein CBS101457_003389 [Exobasidium rhododendri]|nr:hypothetical protein CBS101457_003389 [Exobasidium rhododendri]